MNQIVTTGIVLTRLNFGEADRIVIMLTPDHGKVRVLAKGARRAKSKLAGGIELFSLSHITLILGRGEVSTLISSRLIEHYGQIVQDIDRTMQGYELVKLLNKSTEDAAGPEYFQLLQQLLAGLNDLSLHARLTELWFYSQLIKLSGRMPMLREDAHGKQLTNTQTYIFDYEKMGFIPKSGGKYTPHHIKFLRLAFAVKQPKILKQVENGFTLLDDTLGLIKTIHKLSVRL